MELTDRQLSIYEYILHHHQKYAIAPTVREICDYLGLKGPAGVHRILNVLIEKGFIESTPGKKRSWRPMVPIDYDKSIPLAGSIAAGEPISIQDHVEEYLPVDPAKNSTARQKNRRTEIILTPDLGELYRILDSY